MARAGSPRRAGRVADIRTPIIVAEVTSRRRSGLRGSAARAIANQETARRIIEAIIKRGRDQHPAGIGADDAGDHVLGADPVRGERRQSEAEDAATPSPMRLATRWRATA